MGDINGDKDRKLGKKHSILAEFRVIDKKKRYNIEYIFKNTVDTCLHGIYT